MEPKKLLGFYNYTVILTYAGMLSGFLGIVNVLRQRPFLAVICLLVAGLCDMLDGAVASTSKKRTPQEKSFGIQIDSLSDLVCFGILPALFVCGSYRDSNWVLLIGGLFALCGLIRLAYFNVDEAERQKTTAKSRSIYYGLPITASALIVPALFELDTIFGLHDYFPMPIALVITAVLYLLPFRLKKPKTAGKMCLVLCGIAILLLLAVAHKCGSAQ